jgi:hypothetical protein
VSDQQFLFVLTVSDNPGFDSMLADLAARVLADTGCAPLDAARIVDRLRATLEEAAGEGARGCDIRFQAEGRQLNIVVSYAGREWRVTHALPD